MSAWTRTRRASSATVVAAVLSILVACGTAASAAEVPVDPNIARAADQLNSILPPPMPQQTIKIGRFDGQTKQFYFGPGLPDYYPPNIPPAKWQENGGPVPPQHRPPIKSFNVRYQFDLVNKPPGLRIFVEVPKAGEGMEEKEATISGNAATIDFNVHHGGFQSVRFAYSGGPTVIRLTPDIAPYLGAFVVPYLLTTIIYCPPGGESSASYSTESTAGTVTSFGFARGSGMIETEDPEAMMNLAYDGYSALVGYVGGAAAGKVAGAIADLREQTKTITETTTTRNEEKSKGTFISVREEAGTDTHDYPGKGDVFVVLKDVLFWYVTGPGNKVKLAPVSYSMLRKLTADEMRSTLPAAVAEQYIALDPMLSANPPSAQNPPAPNPHLAPPASSGRTGRLRDIATARLPRRPNRYQFYDRFVCEASAYGAYELKKHDFNSDSVTETATQTVVTHTTGLAKMLEGGGDELYSVTYVASREETTGDETVAGLQLDCGPGEQPFYVDVYFDTIFRTFLAVRGPDLGAQFVAGGGGGGGGGAQAQGNAATGTATDPQGRPAPGARVRVQVGEHSVSVLTDAQGNFRVPGGALPAGDGTIRIGKDVRPIKIGAGPVNGLKLTSAERGDALASADEPAGARGDTGARGSGAAGGSGAASGPGGARARSRRDPLPVRETRSGRSQTQPTASEGDTATAIRGRPNPGDGDDPAARLEARLAELEERVRQLEAKAAGSAAAEAGVATTPVGDGADAGADDTRTAGATPAPGTAPGTTRGAEGQTGPFGPDGRGRAPGGAQGFVVTPNPALKGRLGRVVVTFPKDAKADARVDVTKPNDGNSIKGGYGNFATEVFPGKYDVVINSTKVPVDVVQGSDTRVKAGILRLNLGKETRFDVVDDKGASLTGGYGTKDVGLPAGPAKVKIAEQVEAVEIKDGQVTEF